MLEEGQREIDVPACPFDHREGELVILVECPKAVRIPAKVKTRHVCHRGCEWSLISRVEGKCPRTDQDPDLARSRRSLTVSASCHVWSRYRVVEDSDDGGLGSRDGEITFAVDRYKAVKVGKCRLSLRFADMKRDGKCK